LLAANATVDEVVPGEIVVKFRGESDITTIPARHGLTLKVRGPRSSVAVLSGKAGTERAQIAALRRDARVEWAEPNYLRKPTAIDPRLWAFYNPGGLNMRFTTGTSVGSVVGPGYASTTDADVDNIQNFAGGGTDVIIGSIDTGVELTHPEFTGRLIIGRDWYSNDNDPSDEDGHGTHTAGTMAGATVGVAGVAGAASKVRIFVQRVCGSLGCPSAAIANAIRAAADVPGMVAINLSLGGATETQAERDAIAYATAKNVLVIAAAGNGGSGTIQCPACDPNAISVASTNWRDQKAGYSNYGPGLDISAPGGECYTNTTPEGCIYSAYRGGGYMWMEGTSMAVPHVTGAAALVASKLGMRGAILRARLLGTADPIGPRIYFGSGRLNTFRAVTGSPLAAGR
jgi:subtilisin family serine protease